MYIQLNGQSVRTEKDSAFGIRDELFPANSIVILNGFCIESDAIIHEKDELFIVEKGVMPPEDQLEAMMAARHTPGVQARVKKAKVAIAGLGGLGSNIAVSLARIGVGELLLVDFDTVDPSNLNRQSYFIRHMGMPKTEALKEQIKQINPFIHVITKDIRIKESNVCELFTGYDVLCEAFDNPATKAMLVSTALDCLPDIKVVAASGMAGYASANHICTKKKMENFYICGDYETAAETGNGLMAPRVMICAGHQANMVLRLLMDEENA